MKDWGVGLNNYWFKGSLHLDEVPLFWFYLEILTMKICSLIHWIPFINDWFHIYVCSKVSDKTYKKTDTIVINLPYKFLQQKFPERFKDEDVDEYMDEKDVQHNRQGADELYKEFMEVYNKLELSIENYYPQYVEDQENGKET